MERNANYALVGLISTILLIAMIVFIFWLANFAFSQRYDKYDVVFHGADAFGHAGESGFAGLARAAGHHRRQLHPDHRRHAVEAPAEGRHAARPETSDSGAARRHLLAALGRRHGDAARAGDSEPDQSGAVGSKHPEVLGDHERRAVGD